MLLEPRRLLMEPRRLLLEPRRLLLEPCRMLLDPGRVLLEPHRLLLEPRRLLLERRCLLPEPRRLAEYIFSGVAILAQAILAQICNRCCRKLAGQIRTHLRRLFGSSLQPLLSKTGWAAKAGLWEHAFCVNLRADRFCLHVNSRRNRHAGLWEQRRGSKSMRFA